MSDTGHVSMSTLRIIAAVVAVILLTFNQSILADPAFDNALVKAKAGDAVAQTYLGLMYGTGQGVPLDHNQAKIWYTKAAEQGYAEAQYGLAKAILQQADYSQESHKLAAYWLTKAAEQGYVKAQFGLAVMTKKGHGVQRDLQQAIHWYTKAAEQGDADSQYVLGMEYQSGDVVQKNLQQAIHWFTKAAEQGDAKSQFGLAAIYVGELQSDDAKCYMWASLAVANNNELELDEAGKLASRDNLINMRDICAKRLSRIPRGLELAKELTDLQEEKINLNKSSSSKLKNNSKITPEGISNNIHGGLADGQVSESNEKIKSDKITPANSYQKESSHISESLASNNKSVAESSVIKVVRDAPIFIRGTIVNKGEWKPSKPGQPIIGGNFLKFSKRKQIDCGENGDHRHNGSYEADEMWIVYDVFPPGVTTEAEWEVLIVCNFHGNYISALKLHQQEHVDNQKYKSPEEAAATWLSEMTIKAKAGDVDAQLMLAEAYAGQKGEYIKSDNEQTVFWTQKAAEQGNLEAMRSMGKHAEGDVAVHWYMKCIEKGDSLSAYHLGILYGYGARGVQQDDVKAIAFLSKSVEMGGDPDEYYSPENELELAKKREAAKNRNPAMETSEYIAPSNLIKKEFLVGKWDCRWKSDKDYQYQISNGNKFVVMFEAESKVFFAALSFLNGNKSVTSKYGAYTLDRNKVSWNTEMRRIEYNDVMVPISGDPVYEHNEFIINSLTSDQMEYESYSDGKLLNTFICDKRK